MSIVPTNTPSSDVKIVRATEVDEGGLAAFYQRIDPAKAEHRSRNWRWLYRVDDPVSVSPPLLAMLKGDIVGHAGLIPVTVRMGGRERTAIWFVDFWVLPEYQRMGIGIALTKAWMALCPLQITFCNEKSLGVFLKFGWKARRDTRILRMFLRPESHPRLQHAGTRLIARFAGAATRAIMWPWAHSGDLPQVSTVLDGGLPDDLCSTGSEGLCVPRTADFLRWRLMDNPLKGDYFVFRQKGAPSAIARSTRPAGHRRLDVLAVGNPSRDRRDIAHAISGIIRWAARSGIGEVVYLTSDPGTARALRPLLPFQSRALFAYYAEDPEDERCLREGCHFWEALDSDIDLARFGFDCAGDQK